VVATLARYSGGADHPRENRHWRPRRRRLRPGRGSAM